MPPARNWIAMVALLAPAVSMHPIAARAQHFADGFRGIVYEDVDASGTWDATVDNPLVGWRVYADLNQDRTWQGAEPQATTGPDGTYFVVVPPGSYTARLETAAGWASVYPADGAIQVTVVSANPGNGVDDLGLPTPPLREGDPEVSVTEGMDFGVYRPASVGGLAWADLDGDGRRSGTESGMSGVAVRLLAATSSTILGVVTTDPTGRWVFEGLLPGSYRAQVFTPPGMRISNPDAGPDNAPSDFDPTSGLSATIELTAGQVLADVNVGLVHEAFVRFAHEGSRVVEGSAATALLQVQLHIPSGLPLQAPAIVTVEDAFSGNATPGEDYLLEGPEVTFPAGSADGTEITYPVRILDDNVLESVESVRLRLAIRSGPVFPSAPTQHEILVDDNDGRGFTVTAAQGNTTDENGRQASFAVVLDAIPLANVVIQVRSSDPGEGSVSPSMLTFTGDTWQQPQTVTVTGVDDPDFDGTVAYAVVLDPHASADPSWSVLQPVALSFANLDNEVRLSGRLWQDVAPENAYRDASDGRLPAWPVRIIDALGTSNQTTLTDESGSYAFLLSGGGGYSLAFPPEMGYVQQDVGTDDTVDSDADEHGVVHLELVDGQEARHVDAGITSAHGWDFSIRVFLDQDRDGIRDPGEDAPLRVTVFLTSLDGSVVFSAQPTEQTGLIRRFVGLHELRQGDFRLSVQAPPGFYFTQPSQGSDRSADSDIDPASGFSAPFRLDFPGCCTHEVSGFDIGLQAIEYTLSVATAGGGNGRIVSQPDGIACGASCSAPFASGTVVLLTALPDPGSVFAGWSGDCPGSEQCSLLMNRARRVTAYFASSSGPPPLLQRWMLLLAVGGESRRFRIDLCEDIGPWLQAPIAATAVLDRVMTSGWGSSAVSAGCSDDRVVVRVVDEGLGLLLTKELALPGPRGSDRILTVGGVTRTRPWPDDLSAGRPLDVSVRVLDHSRPVLQMIYDVPEGGTMGIPRDSPLLLDAGDGLMRGFGSAEPSPATFEAMLVTMPMGETAVFIGKAQAAKLIVAHGFDQPMSWELGIAVEGVDSLGTVESLIRGGLVRGRVFVDLDRSGARDPGEPGLAGIPVGVFRNGSLHASTKSGDDGRWGLALEPGSYLARIGSTAAEPAGRLLPFILAPDDDVSGVDLAMEPASGVPLEDPEVLPSDVTIDSVFPNPFRERISVAIRLAEATEISAFLYDMVGRRVDVMAPSPTAAGYHVIVLSPPPLAAGGYLLVVRAGARTMSSGILRAN